MTYSVAQQTSVLVSGRWLGDSSSFHLELFKVDAILHNFMDTGVMAEILHVLSFVYLESLNQLNRKNSKLEKDLVAVKVNELSSSCTPCLLVRLFSHSDVFSSDTFDNVFALERTRFLQGKS